MYRAMDQGGDDGLLAIAGAVNGDRNITKKETEREREGHELSYNYIPRGVDDH